MSTPRLEALSKLERLAKQDDEAEYMDVNGKLVVDAKTSAENNRKQIKTDLKGIFGGTYKEVYRRMGAKHQSAGFKAFAALCAGVSQFVVTVASIPTAAMAGVDYYEAKQYERLDAQIGDPTKWIENVRRK